MLPEILPVHIEGGGETLVPLTPITTFKDVSACVRDPGDPLPLILEDSPLGLRVVAGWERPLELLRLWGNMREQVRYSASFTLSHQLRYDLNNSNRPLMRSATPDSMNYNNNIDPWELYELKDELKGLQNMIYTNKTSDPSWNLFRKVSQNDVDEERVENLDKENDANVNNTEDIFGTTFNSHTNDNWHKQKPWRNAMNEEMQNKHLQSLLHESKMASMYGGPFRRGSMPTRSLPHHKEVKDRSYVVKNESYSPSPYKKYKSNSVFVEDLTKLKNPKILHYPNINSSLKEESNLKENYQFYRAGNENGIKIYKGNPQEYSPGSFQEENSDHLNLKPKQKSYIPSTFNATNVISNSDNSDFMFHNGQSYQRQSKMTCLAPTAHNWVKMSMNDNLKNSNSSSKNKSLEDESQFNQFSKPSDKDSPPKTSYSFLPKILSSKSKQHSGQTSSSDITNNITNKNGEICNGQSNGSSFKNKWKSSSDKMNSKIIPMKAVNFKQQNVHPLESKSENENLNRNKYPERDKGDQNRFFGGSSLDSKSSNHSKSPMNHSTKDGIFNLNLKKKPPEISSPIIGLLSERNIMEKPKKSVSKPCIFKPPLQSFKSGLFSNSAKSSSTTKPSFTSEKPNQSTNNILNHTFNFNNSHSDLSSSTTSSSLSSRTNYSNDRLRYNSHSQHATSPSSMSSESDRIPSNPSRKSRSLKRNAKADHRRSYSDPVSEYWQESQKYSNCNPGRMQRRRRHSGGFPANNAGMKDTQLHLTQIPDGGEVTLSELREMATRQQHQIESQQQLLVAREQRLKYLKQQEGRSAQISLEAERLRRLRERVEAQEAKLRRLRALRGQVDSSLLNAASLSSDLEAMRLLFSEKEKELVDAASKVEELTKQLEDVRSGRGGTVIHQNGTAGTNINNTQNHHFQIHHQELDKLRRELLYRNSVNREASTRVATQKEALSTRKDEIARIDKRIAELQQRLYRKRFLNQQLASQISAATQAKQAQLKAVQQKAKREGNKDNSLDDITTDERRTIEDIAHFERGAQDPKYQTLPYNTKFSSGNKEGSQCINSGTSLGPPQTSTVPNCGSNVVTRTVHSIPTHLPSKGHASAPLTSGSSVVAGSTASHTVPIPSPQMSHPATSSLNRGHQNGSLRPNYLHQQQQQTSHLPLYSSKIPQSDDSNSNKQLQSQQTIHNGSSLQDQRANLPPTSLSVSFSQKHNNQSIAANGQPRSTPLSNSHQCSLQPVNKDVENVRALGFTPGGSNSSVPGVKSMSSTNGASVSVDESSREASTGNVKIKPSLPPKPSPHSKPTPPPRQKGDPLAGSTESLNLTGVTRNNSQSRPQVFRYASQNVILSTYTQQQQQQQQQSSQEQKPQSLQSEPKQIDSKQQQDSQSSAQFQQSSNSGNSTLSQQYKEAKQLLSNETGIEPKEASIKDNNEATGEKVHVSISRRIEIPPDFLFPEDATPPSDLIGRPLDDLSKTGGSSSSDSGYDAPDKIHNINNNDIITKNNTNNNINKNSSSNSVSINNNNNNNNSNMKTVNNFNTLNNVTSTLNDIERLKVSTNAESQTQEVRKKHQKLNVNVEDLSEKELNEETNEKGEEAIDDSTSLPTSTSNSLVVRRLKKGNLKTPNSSRAPRRVSFDPLALLLDASLEGELELVKRTATEVTNPSAANDEGITALHNAICAGHLDIVTFLVTFGCDVNAQDSDGWTPLHCAASCNNVAMVRFLVEHGACVLATTLSDHETAAEKCEQDEEGYDGCSQYLYSVQEKLGIMNGGVVYAVYDYDAQNDDELTLKCSDRLTILRRGDEYEPEWWWAKNDDKKPGYVPRNLLGLYPRVKNIFKDSCT